ncbi:MAG: hypothetical protein ACLQJR_08450 [Stellaceae bacterium]
MPEPSAPAVRPSSVKVRSSLTRTWLVVSALWTVSLLLRIHHDHAGRLGWAAILEDWQTWLGLLGPPLALAAILAAIRGPSRLWTERRNGLTDQRR